MPFEILENIISFKRKFRPKRDSNPDLHDSGAVFNQLSYQANWELAVAWVNDKSVDCGYI